jgi:protein phosphatase
MTKAKKPHLDVYAATDPGLTGKINEDRFLITSFKPEPMGKSQSTLMVLCDGVGGHRAGDVAAEMGVSLITQKILGGDARQPIQAIETAVVETNDAIYQASTAEKDRRGMGTTLALAWVIETRLYTANLGDTRIYLWRENYLVQLTTDHTWVQEALDAGLISEKTTNAHHANAHVIRRYLGSKKRPQPDFRLWFFDKEKDTDALKNQGLRLKPGDILLLCSDGLTDLVADEEIQGVLEATPIESAPEKLIEMANQRAGHDNITVICAEVSGKQVGLQKKKGFRRFTIGCLSFLVFLSLLATGIFFGLRWRNQNLWLEDTPQPEITLTLPGVSTTRAETQSPSATQSPTSTLERQTPRPTLTPWPTNTP